MSWIYCEHIVVQVWVDGPDCDVIMWKHEQTS